MVRLVKSRLVLATLGMLFLNVPVPSHSADLSFCYEQITEGTSTQEDVRMLLGKPRVIAEGTMGPGIVIYAYGKAGHHLQFAFNQAGVVTYKVLTLTPHRGHLTMRQSNVCIAPSEHSGQICGLPAFTLDKPRGGMVCEKHMGLPRG